MIAYKGDDTAILGTKRHGKSYFAKKTLLQQPCGVLYFNAVSDNVDAQGFTMVDGSYYMHDILWALEKGLKLNYNAPMEKSKMERELEFLCKVFMSKDNREFVFAIEEVHLLEDKNTLSMLDDMSFAGRHRGINPVWITQRPQSLPRACITQTTQLIMFNMNFEDSWLKNYGLNADDLKKEIQGRKQYYCRWTPQGGLEAARKI